MRRRASSPRRPSRASGVVAEELDASGQVVRRYGRGVMVSPAKSKPAKSAPPTRSFRARLLGEAASIFLPAGYPDSVRSEYLYFQTFDTLQGACSYLRNILTTSAILRGAGVGEGAASPMAAAIAWVLRDGFGMFGSLIFSYCFGSGFDRNVKEWRLFADLINDVGLTLDMLAPLAGSSAGFAVVAALGASCKSICGLVAGACRASVTAHFALRDNLADVSAKEGAQETAVTLCGLLVGSALAQALGDSQATCWGAFALLTAVHVWANYLGVGALALVSLNRQRASLLCAHWWRGGPAAQGSSRHATALPTPTELAREEQPWRPLVLWLRGPRLAAPLSSLLAGTAAADHEAALRDLSALYRAEQYVLRVGGDGEPCVALKAGATGADLLKALLHCALLSGCNRSADEASWLPCDAARSVARVAPEQACGTHRLSAARPRTAGGGYAAGLGVEEREALRVTLAAVERAWPAFRGSVAEAGWQEAALRLDGVGGTRVWLA